MRDHPLLPDWYCEHAAPPDRNLAQLMLERLRAARTAPRRTHTTRPVVLYGAGELGQLAAAWCRDFGASVLGVIDADAVRWRDHPAWRGCRVLAPDDAPPDWRREHRLLVCISTLPQAPLAADLLAQGWAQVQPFYDFVDGWPVRHPLNNGWRSDLPGGGLALARLREVLDGWGDAASRAHHLQFLAWRCRRLEWSFPGAPVVPAERYFVPELAACWRPGERILDGGAYHGGMLARWVGERPGWLDRAWAVEPDPGNFAVLEGWHARLPQARRIELHRVALGRRAGARRFVAGQGYGSRLWASGSSVVEAVRLDDLPWTPSCVKLHLEGGEWAALCGGASMLAVQRPLLALTVYHRRDGLWAAASHLMRTLPDYRWLFRIHGWVGTAAVIYGLPRERCG